MTYTMPYIKDKSLYAATMFACKLIREKGWFNKACQKAADYYDVDVDEVKRCVRARQSAGQKRANANSPKRKYKYFLAWGITANDMGERLTDGCAIVRGLSLESVKRTLARRDDERSRRDYSDSVYAPCYFHFVDGPYETEDDARADAENCYLRRKESRRWT